MPLSHFRRRHRIHHFRHLRGLRRTNILFFCRSLRRLHIDINRSAVGFVVDRVVPQILRFRGTRPFQNGNIGAAGTSVWKTCRRLA
jgi:hypothetical protein